MTTWADGTTTTRASSLLESLLRSFSSLVSNRVPFGTTYYIDPAGSDAANGLTQATAWQTVANLNSRTFKEGDRVLFKRGGTWRGTVIGLVAAQHTGLTVGAYGQNGPDPILSGGVILTSFTASGTNTGITAPQSAWSDMSAGDLYATTWTMPAGSVPQISVYVDGNAAGGTVSTDIYGVIYADSAGAPAAKIAQSAVATITAGQAAGWVNLVFATPPTLSATTYHLSVFTNAAAGTPVGRVNYATGGYASHYRTGLSGVTAPNPYGTPTGSGTFGYTIYASTGSASNTYSKTTASPRGVTVLIVTYTAGGVTTVLAPGSGSGSLTANQYFYSAGVLYVNLGGTNPSAGTIEVANASYVLGCTAPLVTFKNLDFRYGADGALAIGSCNGWVVDSCAFRYSTIISNSGTIQINDGSNATRYPNVIKDCTFDWLANDGIWWHNTSNVEVARCNMTNIGNLLGDYQSDGIQVEDTYGTAPVSDGFWIHDNYINIGVNSPKGCVIVNSDTSIAGSSAGGIVERNVLISGNFGVAVATSNIIVRDNMMLNQNSTFGGGIHVDSGTVRELNNVTITRNLIVGSTWCGIIIQDSTDPRRNWIIANNTIVNSTRAHIYIGAPVSGVIENNILWSTGTPPFLRVLYILSVVSGETLFVDYNLFDSPFTDYLRFGSTPYSTLAAWRVATGYDTHTISADPLFVGNTDYTLQPGSPAIDAGAWISGIGQRPRGTAPDIGYAELGA